MKKAITVISALALLLCGCAQQPAATGTPVPQQTQAATGTPDVTLTPTQAPMPTEFTDNNDQAEQLLKWYQGYQPQVTYVDYDPVGYPGVKALVYEGALFNGSKTNIFAYIGFPAGASAENPVPAVVLQHGGGGFAFPQWIKQWTDRGYAAIAVANTGYRPKSNKITSFYDNKDWVHKPFDFEKEQGIKVIPDNNTTALNGGSDVTRLWMYHAVASCTLAFNLLAADDRVISSQIGLTGISWGGVITSVAMGFDNRFAFYIPIYGCAYLDESKTWMANYFTPKTCQVWNATTRLDRVTSPILWLCWAEDTAFSINTNDASYAATASHATLSIRYGMGHSHDLGWIPYDSYRFADWVTGKGEKMCTVAQPDASMGRELSLALDAPSDATNVKAVLYYLKGGLEYKDSNLIEHFTAVNCTVADGKVSVTVPQEAHTYYIQVLTGTGNKQYSTSTRVISLN